MSETPTDGQDESKEAAVKPAPRKRAPRKPAAPAFEVETVEESPVPESEPAAEVTTDEPVPSAAEPDPTPAAAAPSAFRSVLSKLNVFVVAGVVAGGLIGGAAGFTVGVHASDLSAGNRAYQAAVAARNAAIASTPTDAAVTVHATVDGKPATFPGVIVSPDGYVITQAPATDPDTAATVTLADGSIVSATLAGRDAHTGIAVFHAAGNDLPYTDTAVAAPAAGDVVTAIGVDGRTITTRIASVGHGVSLDAKATTTDRAAAAWVPTIELGTTNTTAGSPVFTADGHLLAITLPTVTAADGTQTSGFAITAAAAINAAERTVTGVDSQGLLGVSIADSTTGHVGAVVASVTPGTPAAKAKLQPGDIITGFNQLPVRSAADLNADVRNTEPGIQVTFTVQRGQEARAVRVTLGWVKDAPTPTQK